MAELLAPSTHRRGGLRPEVVAVVDAHPILALPSLLSAPHPPASVTFVAGAESDALARRVAELLDRVLPTVDRNRERCFAPFDGLAEAISRAASSGPLTLDVSGASPRAAIEAFRIASSLPQGPCFHLSCFDWRRNRHAVTEVNSPDGATRRKVSSERPADIGVAGRVGPDDFLALFGLRDLPEDPYPAVQGTNALEALRPAARLVLETYLSRDQASALAATRKALAQARRGSCWDEVRLSRDSLPPGIRSACALLGKLGLAREEAGGIILLGPPDRNSLFFLGGGWLEIVCHEALSRGLPDRKVELNAGIRWFPEAPRPEAEADVLFVHGGNLCIVSCKNDWNDERVFTHLRELRALVAEMGEGFVRPTLVSTRTLTDREESRARSYEIGTFSGPPLLAALKTDLDGQAGTFLKALRGRGRGAPGPGRR